MQILQQNSAFFYCRIILYVFLKIIRLMAFFHLKGWYHFKNFFVNRKMHLDKTRSLFISSFWNQFVQFRIIYSLTLISLKMYISFWNKIGNFVSAFSQQFSLVFSITIFFFFSINSNKFCMICLNLVICYYKKNFSEILLEFHNDLL